MPGALNALPRLAGQQLPNGLVANAKHTGQLTVGRSASGVERSDAHNVSLGQLCVSVPLSVSDAPFRVAVRHVRSLRATSQMRGIAARGIVAPVQDVSTSAQVSTMQRKGNPMRQHLLAAVQDGPVAGDLPFASPQPAWPQFGADDRPVLINLLPEPLYQRPYASTGRAYLRTVASISGVQRNRLQAEGVSAVFALSLNHTRNIPVLALDNRKGT